MTLENKIDTPDVTTAKVKKDKAFTVGMLMKRWYQNVMNPFDSVIHGAKYMTYGIHAIPTLRRQEKDIKQDISSKLSEYHEMNKKYDEKQRNLEKELKDNYSEDTEKELKKVKTKMNELSRYGSDLHDKKDRGNGWSVLSGAFATATWGGVYYAGGVAASAALGPVGWAVCGVPLVTQGASHVKEAYTRAKRELKSEYEMKKELKTE